MYILHPNPAQAKRRAEELTEARKLEIYGDAYDGQEFWPDGRTNRAVDVTDLTDGRAAFPADARHERHYTATERENRRGRIDDLLPERLDARR